MLLFSRGTVIEEIEGVHRNQTNRYTAIRRRRSHGLVYKTEGESQYILNHKTLWLKQNELMYLPRQGEYEIRTEDAGSYMMINFTLRTDPRATEPTRIAFQDHTRVLRLFQQMQHLWVLKSEHDYIMAKSVLYQIMAEIARQQEAEYTSPRAREMLSDAIQYLKRHLYDPELRVSDLHELVGVSSTYFRELFRQVYAMTPRQYILRERIEQAKALLVSGEFPTIDRVASAVGYTDMFYFCKVFKKITGRTPTEWKQDAAGRFKRSSSADADPD